MDGFMNVLKTAQVLEASVRLWYLETTIVGIGILLITCTLLYVIPRTSIFGAILLTGYLGGAVATQVRVGSGWFETLFPVLFGGLIWGGLWLRDLRLQSLLTPAGRPTKEA